MGKPEEKRALGRPKRRWQDNIKISLIKIGSSFMDWIGLAQGRDQRRSLEHNNEPSGSIKCWEILE
jgi:hypothetical protein